MPLEEPYREGALRAALADMPAEFCITMLASHAGILTAYHREAPDRALNTHVGGWLAYEGYRLGVFKHPAHPKGVNHQLWERGPWLRRVTVQARRRASGRGTVCW